jgi:hypothetical protein
MFVICCGVFSSTCQCCSQSFPAALSADDFISRVEIALAGYGFTGDNSIGEPVAFPPCLCLPASLLV